MLITNSTLLAHFDFTKLGNQNSLATHQVPSVVIWITAPYSPLLSWVQCSPGKAAWLHRRKNYMDGCNFREVRFPVLISASCTSAHARTEVMQEQEEVAGVIRRFTGWKRHQKEVNDVLQLKSHESLINTAIN